jgi:hypothetical protein
MRHIQNLKQKPIARNTMIVLAAIMFGTVVVTDALAAGHGGGGGFGGGHTGGGLGGGHVGGGFTGGGFAGGGLAGSHISSGFVEGRMAGDGNRGGGDSHGPHMGDRPHDRDHHSDGRIHVVPGYDDYDYAGDSACFQYRNVYTTAGRQWRQVWVCN